jgi:hypothetical protein
MDRLSPCKRVHSTRMHYIAMGGALRITGGATYVSKIDAQRRAR